MTDCGGSLELCFQNNICPKHLRLCYQRKQFGVLDCLEMKANYNETIDCHFQAQLNNNAKF